MKKFLLYFMAICMPTIVTAAYEKSTPQPVHVVDTTGGMPYGGNQNPMIVTISTGSNNVVISTAPLSTVFKYGQVVVSSGSTPALIVPSDTARTNNVTICNESSVTFYIGDASVTTTNGMGIQSGQCWWAEGPSIYNGAIYGQATALYSTASWNASDK